MAPNTFGDIFQITTFGESHGAALGVTIDGCPPGIPLQESDFLPELARRRPGQSDITTPRQEADEPRILSGVFEGVTTGHAIAVIVANTSQRSGDYHRMKDQPRPGHADETYQQKYGIRDHRGGGRSSGRETVSRVLAGVVARKILPQETRITGHAVQIGSIKAESFDADAIERNPVRCADSEAAIRMEQYIREMRNAYNSVGGIIEIITFNPPPNLGDPVFAKMKDRLASALMSIGAVTGFEYGAGFRVAEMTGKEYVTNRANFGGMLGGITTGDPLVTRISVKPTSSIGDVAKEGRHDPCIVPRVIPVAEAMTAIVLADAYLRQKMYEAFRANVKKA